MSSSSARQLVETNEQRAALDWEPRYGSRRPALLRFVAFLGDHYFRARVICRDPELLTNPETPVLFAGNHSGMSFPWDALVFVQQIERYVPGMKPTCAIIASSLIHSRIMQLFGVDQFWKTFGIDASTKNFEVAADSDLPVLIYPEGIAGIGKGFHRRYQLQKFSTSTLRVSLRTGRPIVPVYTVNGEFLNPLAYQWNWLSGLARKIGIPFLPVGLMTPVYLLFPAIYFSVLPARLTYVVGPRIDPRRWVESPGSPISEAEIKRLSDRLHLQMQTDLLEAVQTFGKRPYEIDGLFRQALTLGWRAWRLVPFAWSFSFHAADHDHVPEASSSLSKRLWSSLASALLMLPLIGWPLYFAMLAFGRTRPKPTSVAFPARRS